MRSTQIELKKLTLKLTDHQREILTGILLGDAHLETQNKGRTYRLKIEQSVKHFDYVNHLYEVFKDWVNTPPKERTVKRSSSISTNIRFSTLSHESLRFYAHQFYGAGPKSVSKQIHKWLTPRGLAYWYMDDGSRKSNQSKGVIFNTQGFGQVDVELLSRILLENFNLENSIRKQKDGLQIYVSGHSSRVFQSIVEPYVINSMRYKLPHEV
jgi:hypothetical protein